MISENLDTFLSDFGVPVVFGAVSGFGILDQPDDILGELSISTDYQLTLKTSDFGALKSGDSITVNSVAYTVRKFKQMTDGNFGIATLSKV